MITGQPLESPKGEVTKRSSVTTAVLILAIILLLLLPVHAYFFALTRDSPPWLQWTLYSLLSLIAVTGLIGLLFTWRQLHPLLRWLDLLGALGLLVGFSWLMFHSHSRFQEKMDDNLLLASVPWALSKFLGKRFQARKGGL